MYLLMVVVHPAGVSVCQAGKDSWSARWWYWNWSCEEAWLFVSAIASVSWWKCEGLFLNFAFMTAKPGMSLRDVIFCCFVFLALRKNSTRAKVLWAHLSTKCQSSHFPFSLLLSSLLLSQERNLLTSELKPHIRGKRRIIIANSRKSSSFLPPTKWRINSGKHLTNPSTSFKPLQVCNTGHRKGHAKEDCAEPGSQHCYCITICLAQTIYLLPNSTHELKWVWQWPPAVSRN